MRWLGSDFQVPTDCWETDGMEKCLVGAAAAGNVCRTMGRFAWVVSISAACCGSWISGLAGVRLEPDGFHVHPGEEIQEALQAASQNPTNKVVRVHAGVYRPSSPRQALIWFHQAHNGIHLLAEGPVTLSAENRELSSPTNVAHPAIVNHVVYFGDGVGTNTVLRGFRLTGANHFVSRENTRQIEPNRTIPKNYFFYSDGGGVKIFGRSYPTLQDLEIVDNYTSPCGAGISVQHQGFRSERVRILDCRFRGNRAQGTGAAVDLLAGSAALIENCLFVGNSSNQGPDPVAQKSGERPFENNGVLTIFWNSEAIVRNCTFTENRNGIDDMGGASRYENCVLVDNLREDGLPGHRRYELAVNGGANVMGCLIRGKVHDARQVIDPKTNRLEAPEPRFNADYEPQAPEYQAAGYRRRKASEP